MAKICIGADFDFFHVCLQTVTATAVHSSNERLPLFFFLSLSLIMAALKCTQLFFTTAEAHGSRWVSDGWSGVGRVPTIWEWHRRAW